jgi:fructose-1,6-bisphosphatase/inositol monophosphatase family enzyme
MNSLRLLGYHVKPSSQNATDILAMLDGGIAGFISLFPGVYDVWSPAAIIQESGGWLSDWLGSSLRFDRKTRVPHVLVAATEKIAKHTLPVLKSHV